MLQSALLDGLAQRPTDLARLIVVPAFAWAAWQDVEVRRVPNRLWPPLALLGVVLLGLDALHWHSVGGFYWRQFLMGTAISVLIVIPLVYGFWLVGGFGGADVKAIATLAILFPTFPVFYLEHTVLPLVQPHANAFALSVLTNAVVVGLLYPAYLAALNLARGDHSTWMFLGRRTGWDDLDRAHGRLLEEPAGFTRAGLDVDALRMYLRWRGLDLADLRERADELRDPATLPDEPNPPTDGAIDRGQSVAATDGGRPEEAATDEAAADDAAAAGATADEAAAEATADAAAAEATAADATGADVAAADATGADVAAADATATDAAYDDPWGAEAFLAAIDRGAYGTDAQTLRDGLEVVAERESIWLSPGVPFIVPVFAGLLVALTYGDLLFGLMGWLGLV